MLVEDFSKFIMRVKSISWVRVLPQMMHGGFISTKTCDAITKKFETLAENADAKFTEEECAIIKVNCVEAIKTKWADRQKLEKENPSLQNQFKQLPQQMKADEVEQAEDEPKEAAESEPSQIEASKPLDQKPVVQKIGQKRSNPRQASSVSKPSSEN